MQRGRIIILGDVGINLGDSMYDGTIFIGGKIGSFGSDAVPSDLTDSDQDWLKRKLKVATFNFLFNQSWSLSVRSDGTASLPNDPIFPPMNIVPSYIESPKFIPTSPRIIILPLCKEEELLF